MKKRIPLTIAVFLLIIFTSCTLFGPTPSISEFSSTDTDKAGVIQVDTDETFTLTVSGTTMDSMSSSDLTDYSGTITISSSPAGIVASKTSSLTATFDTTATDETFVVSFPAAGDYSVIATLTDSVGASVTRTLSATVEEGTVTLPTTSTSLTYNNWDKTEAMSTGDSEWYKYNTTVGNTYNVYFLDDSASYNDSVANVTVNVYDEDGYEIATGTGGKTTSFSGTVGYAYVEVECISGASDYAYLAIANTTASPYETLSTSNTTSNGTLSAGEIEVWEFAPTTGGYYYVEFADDYTNTSEISEELTADIRVSVFDDYYHPLNYRDDGYNSGEAPYNTSIYCTSSTPIYIVVEGYSTSSAGTYLVDVDTTYND